MILKTERTRVRRIPERGHYDKEIIYNIKTELILKNKKITKKNPVAK